MGNCHILNPTPLSQFCFNEANTELFLEGGVILKVEGIISVCVKCVKYLKVPGNEDGGDTQIQDKYRNLMLKPIELLNLSPS